MKRYVMGRYLFVFFALSLSVGCGMMGANISETSFREVAAPPTSSTPGSDPFLIVTDDDGFLVEEEPEDVEVGEEDIEVADKKTAEPADSDLTTDNIDKKEREKLVAVGLCEHNEGGYFLAGFEDPKEMVYGPLLTVYVLSSGDAIQGPFNPSSLLGYAWNSDPEAVVTGLQARVDAKYMSALKDGDVVSAIYCDVEMMPVTKAGIVVKNEWIKISRSNPARNLVPAKKKKSK